jgi:hypothetical protein
MSNLISPQQYGTLIHHLKKMAAEYAQEKGCREDVFTKAAEKLFDDNDATGDIRETLLSRAVEIYYAAIGKPKRGHRLSELKGELFRGQPLNDYFDDSKRK